MPWRERLAANLGLLWHELPLLERIEQAGAAGFRAVELHAPDVSAPEVRVACDDAGVRLLGVNTRSAIAAERAASARFKEEFAALLDWCFAAGASAIHILAGQRGDGEAVFLDHVGWAADLAGPSGVGILLEPLNRHDRPGWYYHLPAKCAAVLRQLNRANVGMQFDAYHVGREGLDACAQLDAHLPWIHHVQIAAVPDRGEPDQGTMDYARLLKHLIESSYAGWIGCEYVPRSTMREGLGWIDRLDERLQTR